MVCLFMHSHLLQNKFINGITFVCWNLFLRFIRVKQEKRIRSCVKMNQFAESLFWLMTHLTEQFLTLCNHFLILFFLSNIHGVPPSMSLFLDSMFSTKNLFNPVLHKRFLRGFLPQWFLTKQNLTHSFFFFSGSNNGKEINWSNYAVQ